MISIDIWSKHQLTLPLRFQVPMKIVQCFVVEYSDNLHNINKTIFSHVRAPTDSPLSESRPNRIVDRIKDSHRMLVTQISLGQQ